MTHAWLAPSPLCLSGSRACAELFQGVRRCQPARARAALHASRAMCASGAAPVRLQQLYEAGKAAFGSGRKAQPAELEHLRHLMGPCLLAAGKLCAR